MVIEGILEKALAEIENGLDTCNCTRCGCMIGPLKNLEKYLDSQHSDNLPSDFRVKIGSCLNRLQPIEKGWFSCKHCFGAEAANLFSQVFPNIRNIDLSSLTTKTKEISWPALPGEYFVVSRKATVAVSTLASDSLAESIAQSKPDGLCIAGKTETENIGIEKVVRNTITNPSIRFLVIAGKEPEGHCSGTSLLALAKNGVNNKMRIAGAPGNRPILMNSSLNEIEIFRRQIEVVDMMGCEDKGEITQKIASISAKQKEPFIDTRLKEPEKGCDVLTISETRKNHVTLDKAGYFVILPERENGDIVIEYYGYDNRLLKVVRGKTSRDLYTAIINNGWVTELSHAAYLGNELEKAELSIRFGFRYIQDGA